MSDPDLVTSTRVANQKMRAKPFTYGSLFMGASPLDTLWDQEMSEFHIDDVNQVKNVCGRTIGPKLYQRLRQNFFQEILCRRW